MIAAILEDVLQLKVSPSRMDENEGKAGRREVMSRDVPTIFDTIEQYSDKAGDLDSLINDFIANATFNNTDASFPNTTTTTTTTAMFSASTLASTTTLNDTECSSASPFMESLPWIRITFGLLMVFENVLSLMALWRVKHMQTAIHKFISSLAVAELLMGVWCCYRYGAEILMGSDLVTVECRIRFVGNTYLNFVAILSVCALCLDRCIALHVPYRYVELVTGRRLKQALGVIWVLPLSFVLTAYVQTQSDDKDCSFIHIASQRTYIVLTVVRCVLISLIIASQLLIFRAARCQIVKIFPNVLSMRNSNRFLRANAKASITTMAVVVPFLLLYFPVLLVQGNLAVRPEADCYQSQLLAFVWLFASAHGLFTPVIFCWRFREVRKNLMRMFPFCFTVTPPSAPGVFHLRTNENDSRSASTA